MQKKSNSSDGQFLSFFFMYFISGVHRTAVAFNDVSLSVEMLVYNKQFILRDKCI